MFALTVILKVSSPIELRSGLTKWLRIIKTRLILSLVFTKKALEWLLGYVLHRAIFVY